MRTGMVTGIIVELHAVPRRGAASTARAATGYSRPPFALLRMRLRPYTNAPASQRLTSTFRFIYRSASPVTEV